MPYTSAAGHMTSFLDPTGAMALRLTHALRDEFIATYGTRIAEQHGRVMPDFVIVPELCCRTRASFSDGWSAPKREALLRGAASADPRLSFTLPLASEPEDVAPE